MAQPPYGPPPPHGPQPFPPPGGTGPYGPQRPYPPQHPSAQYGAPQPGFGGGYPPPPRPKQGNGCLIGGILAAVVAVLAAVSLVVVFFAVLGNGSDDDVASGSDVDTETPQVTETPPDEDVVFVRLPDCSVGETDVLATLVPDHRPGIDESIDTDGQDWWEGNACDWLTPSGAAEPPAYAYLAVVRNETGGGASARTWAAEDLEWYAEDYPTTQVEGLGEEAVSWYDTEAEVGCVATYRVNLSLSVCYDRADSSGAPIDQETAVAEARELTAAALTAIEDGDYR